MLSFTILTIFKSRANRYIFVPFLTEVTTEEALVAVIIMTT